MENICYDSSQLCYDLHGLEPAGNECSLEQCGTPGSDDDLVSYHCFLLSQLSLPSEDKIFSMKSSQETSPLSPLSLKSDGSNSSMQGSSLPSDRSFSSVSSQCSSSSEGKIKSKSNRMYRCLTSLTGHVGHVSSIVVTGEFLYSASQGNDIRIWRHPDLGECGRFGRGEGAVKALLVTRDRVFSAHQDHKIRVWRRSRSTPTGHKLVATLPTVKDCLINCVSQKNYVQVRRHHMSLWIEHVDTISALAVGKKNLLYSSSWDKTFKVWRLSDLKCVESIKAHDDAVNSLIAGEDGFVYTASADGTVKVWTKKVDEKKHSLVATLEGHKAPVNALVLSPDGATLYSGGSDGSMIVWQREEGIPHMKAVSIFQAHPQAVLCLCTAGNLLLSGSADKTVRVWNTEAENKQQHSCVAVLKGHKAAVKTISVSTDMVAGFLVYSGGMDKSIKVWWVSDIKEGNSDHQRNPSVSSELLDW